MRFKVEDGCNSCDARSRGKLELDRTLRLEQASQVSKRQAHVNETEADKARGHHTSVDTCALGFSYHHYCSYDSTHSIDTNRYLPDQNLTALSHIPIPKASGLNLQPEVLQVILSGTNVMRCFFSGVKLEG